MKKKMYMYTWNWYVSAEGLLDESPVLMCSFDKPPRDKDAVVLNVQDVDFTVPDAATLRQGKLESLEQKYAEYRKEVLERMQKLEREIEELRALPAPLEVENA